MIPEALRCWVCGSNDLHIDEGHVKCGLIDEDFALVRCCECNTCGPRADTPAWAIVGWNACRRRNMAIARETTEQ